MAKRASSEEKPFRPLDISILRSVANHAPAARTQSVEPEPESKLAATPPVVEARREPESRPVALPDIKRLDHEKRILFTKEEHRALERLVHNLAGRVGAQIKISHVLRAVTALLLHAESQVDRRAAEKGRLTRPPNGDMAALQRFELQLAEILLSAMRDAGLP